MGVAVRQDELSGLSGVALCNARTAMAAAARRQRCGIDRPPAPKKPAGMSKSEWRGEKQKMVDRAKMLDIVNPHAQAHGSYERVTIVDLGGEHGEGRNRSFQAVLNRGGTAVDRWIANDTYCLFEEPQQQAIRYCRSLWSRASGITAVDPSAEPIDTSRPDGWSQQEALNELQDLKDRTPARYWSVFENVCRWDEEAGVAGSSIAGNKRSAVDAARTTVAFVASLIAMWRGL